MTGGDEAEADRRATGRLLEETFPGAGVGSPDYLRWLYARSPFGPVVQANRDDDAGRAAHYALVPLRLIDGTRGDIGAALSLNTAVHERVRKRGLFTEVAEATYAQAREQEIRVVVGVANDNSTPGFVRRLRFQLVGQLPVAVVPRMPLATRDVRSAAVTAAFLESAELDRVESYMVSPVSGLARSWTADALRWRLAAPGRSYTFHEGDEAIAVSCAASRHGLRVAVLCAVFAPSPLSRRSFAALAAAACRHHRAGAAIRIGVNRHLPSFGIPLPTRLRESPLNLIYRDLDDASRPPPPIARWEPLDFDAF